MRGTWAVFVVVGIVSASPAVIGAGETGDREALFETRIRPVLTQTCFKCHGGEKTSGGLRVGSREELLKGGDSGPSLVTGNPNKSLLIQALRYTSDDLKMPPDKKLPDAVIADFERWVKDGVYWPKNEKVAAAGTPRPTPWAFRPVRKVVPPDDPTGWSSTPIDRFIRAGQKSHGLEPVDSAPKRNLLRRMSFDLVGLPPTEADVDRFIADESPNAIARETERLLASPEYGERWGRHWMDLVRYADTAGDAGDYPVPEAYLYRDYIIASFNSDKPYDEFVREQIAGDILATNGPADRYAERIVATGFLSQSRRYGVAAYDQWHLTLEDTIDTFGRTFLAMTMRCARCHDHKFDPIPTRDYYRLYGVFASTQFPYPGSEDYVFKSLCRSNFVPLLPSDKTTPIFAAYESKLHDLRADLARLENALPQDEVARLRVTLARDHLLDIQRRGSPPALPVAYAVRDGAVVDANVQLGGEPTKLGDKVRRGTPQFLGDVGESSLGGKESGRLELADWVASPRNPLTARVIVNRVWQYHFGRGLVETPSYFGARGAAPTHPELLDWLAASFVEHGWSIKWLHRLILASKTYQLASTPDAAREATDAANTWCWRFQRQRLDAEQIRDAMLFVAGTLDETRAGAHKLPAIEKWNFTQHAPFQETEKSRHRSVYLLVARLHSDPFLGVFDEPDAGSSTEVRDNSTVPQQALFLMNSNIVRSIAESFAQRLSHAGADTATKIDAAHRLAYCRPARPKEIQMGQAYIEQYSQQALTDGLSPPEAESNAWTSYARAILIAHEFFYVD